MHTQYLGTSILKTECQTFDEVMFIVTDLTNNVISSRMHLINAYKSDIDP